MFSSLSSIKLVLRFSKSLQSCIWIVLISFVIRKDAQLSQLTKLEVQLSTSEAAVTQVQERIKTLEIAMQMAREVRRIPFLEQYCVLDKV